MRNRSIALLLSMFFAVGAVAPSSEATVYEIALCPMIGGRFLLLEGQLWLEIAKQDGKPVDIRREKVANPLDDRSHEVLSKRGQVSVEVHQDKKGGLFVHWGTLKDDE